MTREEYKKRFNILNYFFTEAYLSFYIWKGLQDKAFEKTFLENPRFWSATLLAIENTWLSGLAKIYEDSEYSKKAKVISVYALLPYQTDSVRAAKVQNILELNSNVIKNIIILRQHQLAHNNAQHLMNPKAILKRFPIVYADVEKLLLSSGEILSNLNPDKGYGYEYKMWADDCEHDGKDVIKKLQYYSKLRREHYDKLKRGEIDDWQFPPTQSLAN
ncbi:hypothetical protein KJ853_03810 [Patescibacteria group bacterium]|nr:hypothetical protein [Patescibacteria group bacterium]